MNKRSVGTAYEQQAAAYLKEQGYEIVECNYRCRIGEIDIIAREENYLVFVEVKYRTDAGSGSPKEAVNYKKQRIISKVADYYCMTHGCNMITPCRFDVVAIQGEEVELVRNAFMYCG